jgi:phosphonate metabolism protein PhnN/1,5-bisphosphokinase (PRPP-forming)
VSATPVAAGTLVLVVGPSGAGKDSIIAGAAARLRGNADFVFARRAITRPAAAGGEAHIALSTAEFAVQRERGLFLLHWHAHGLDYGIPATLATDRVAGRTVIANVSRAVLDEARHRLQPLAIVQVLASGPVLAARLRNRGRESEADVRRRLDRAAESLHGPDVTTIRNDSALGDAVDAFLAVLSRVAGQAALRVVPPSR